MSGPVIVVEDVLSGALATRLVQAAAPHVRMERAPIVSRGIAPIRSAMPRYMGASRIVPHFILVDQEDWPCAPALMQAWGVTRTSAGLLFRVAVRETEAWVMSDRAGFAAFVGVPVNKLPPSPDVVLDPKQTLISIVRRSRRKRLAEKVVPAQGSPMSIGPLYNEVLIEFVRDHWNLHVAESHSPSLRKAVARLRAFLGETG